MGLTLDMQNLSSNVTSRLGEVGYVYNKTVNFAVSKLSDGRACLSQDTFCAGGTSDALYAEQADATFHFNDTGNARASPHPPPPRLHAACPVPMLTTFCVRD